MRASMSTPRRTLSLKPAGLPDGPALSPEAELIAQAIRRRLCIAAVYNRTAMQIAPHILYTRHDELFVDGVVLLREGKAPAEVKLGTFKLAGLNGVSLTADSFTVQRLYDANAEKYAGVSVAKIG